MKTIKEINERIRKGEVVVVRADEMPEIYEENPKKAAREVDVVTTGTFGAMCSSGVFLNFGHSDPPIKMNRIWLNEVEAYTGIAAVDAYIGATQLSKDKGMEYGGGHVIEDLISGKEVTLRAEAYGTDCYPRKNIETTINLNDLNQAVMLNPRNSYQRYNAATNSTDEIMHTYMGTLLPEMRNVNFAGSGELNPLTNDPEYRTIGLGTRIFLCGAKGYVIGEGTQHSPKTGFGTISVAGNLKEMSPEFIKAAVIPNYGTSLFIGIGIPIPVLDEGIAKSTAIRNRDIKVNIVDYGVERRKRPIVGETTFEELLSGKIIINNKKVRTSPLSSLRKSFDIAETLKNWIQEDKFLLTEYVCRLPRDTEFRPMQIKKRIPRVGEIMTKNVITAREDDSINYVSNLLVKNQIDQIPIVDDENKLVGIVTSWDITNAVAKKKRKLKEIMTRKVITSKADEYIDVVTRRLDKHNIGSTPIVDENNRVIGIISTVDLIKRSAQK